MGGDVEGVGVDQGQASSIFPSSLWLGQLRPSGRGGGGHRICHLTKIWGNYERKTEVCCFKAGATSADLPPRRIAVVALRVQCR